MGDKKVDSTIGTRRDLLDIKEDQPESRFIEAIGKDVFFRKMNAKDEDSYNWSMMQWVDVEGETRQKLERDLVNSRCKYLVRVLCTAKGDRLFADDEHELLGRKPPNVIKELFEKAQEVAGLDVKTMEKVEKNSDAEPTEDLPSV